MANFYIKAQNGGGMWHSDRFHWVWMAWFLMPYANRHVPCIMDDFGTLTPVQSVKALHFIND